MTKKNLVRETRDRAFRKEQKYTWTTLDFRIALVHVLFYWVDEPKSIERTIVDTFLVGLSAANTLHQDLSAANVSICHNNQFDPIYTLADAAGRFADACEKIDHLEEFMPIARQANIDVLKWTIEYAAERHVDLETAVQGRRRELAARQFYIAD